MAELKDYIEWRGDLRFRQSRLNEIDNVLLVFFTYLDLNDIVSDGFSDSITFRDAANAYFEQGKKTSLGVIAPTKLINETVRQMAETERFGKIELSGYIDKYDIDGEEQFAAYTARLDDGSIFISFRGTDETLVGWKEDLNLTFVNETRAQRSAVEYVASVAAAFDGKIRIGGHSKGGNLAVYAAAMSDPAVRERIVRVYSIDGPGFSREFLDSEGYLDIKERIVKLVPRDTVVGMIFCNDENYSVIKSRKMGLEQHIALYWEVKGKHFVRLHALPQRTVAMNNALNTWLEQTDTETKRELSEAIYHLLTAGNATTLTDFTKDKLLLLKSLAKVEPQKRDMVFRQLTKLIGELIKSQTIFSNKPKKNEKEDEEL
ncbi:MAG: DUF2974 domain-containing protein [Clostridia bacterium]|nr:DUF2974 domain-containing protein [Clostridia bacterium]